MIYTLETRYTVAHDLGYPIDTKTTHTFDRVRDAIKELRERVTNSKDNHCMRIIFEDDTLVILERNSMLGGKDRLEIEITIDGANHNEEK